MALSTYKSHQNSLNRFRSSSCSSPIRNQIVYREIYSVGENTLVRSYSCDQVFAKDEAGQTFQTTKIQVSSFITPEKKLCGTPTERIKECQTEPKKLTYNTLTPDKVMAKKRLKMNTTPTTKPPNQSLGLRKKTITFSILPILSACVLYFLLSEQECNYVWDLTKTNKELEASVLGQSDAITKINIILNFCNSTNDAYTMIFTGGVGVGKTLSSSIISRNFPWSTKKLITFSNNFNKDMQYLLKKDLSTCGVNLITVDDLTVKNTIESINFVEFLHEKRKKNEKLLIILIFKTPTETHSRSITKDFRNTYFNFYHVPFINLTSDVVEECFKREMKRQRVHIEDKSIKELVKSKMSPIKIVKGLTGCKGVADEVAHYEKRKK